MTVALDVRQATDALGIVVAALDAAGWEDSVSTRTGAIVEWTHLHGPWEGGDACRWFADAYLLAHRGWRP